MLLLTRRPSQTIVINGNIEISILAISGKLVRVGVVAPPEVLVLRGELTLHSPAARSAALAKPRRR